MNSHFEVIISDRMMMWFWNQAQFPDLAVDKLMEKYKGWQLQENSVYLNLLWQVLINFELVKDFLLEAVEPQTLLETGFGDKLHNQIMQLF